MFDTVNTCASSSHLSQALKFQEGREIVTHNREFTDRNNKYEPCIKLDNVCNIIRHFKTELKD